MSKLGPHGIRTTDAGLRWARKASIVKQIDSADLLRVAPDWAIRVYRKYYQHQDVMAARGGAAVARDIIASLNGYNHPRLYVEVFNEWRQRIDEIAYHVDVLAEAVPVLHAAGYKVAGFSFSTGNPEREVWQYIKAHNYCGVDAIAIHEYWGEQGFSTWNALRYKRAHDWLGEGHPSFIVTECGRDAVEGGEGKPGWKAQGISAERYLAELLAYDAELQKDDYILGATVYATGTYDDFKDFSVDELVDRLPAASGPVIQPPQGGNMFYRLGTIDIEDLRGSLPRHATLKYERRNLGTIKRIVIHHSASAPTTTAEAMARYHVDTNSWPGIGYHFVVTADGRIQYVNDHTLITYGVAGQNADTVHICLPGDFTSAPPPAAQLAATKSLIDNYRLAMGQSYPIVGHRDIADSSCPGDTWPRWKGQLMGEIIINPSVDYKVKYDEALKTIAAQNGELVTLREKITAALKALS